MINMIKYTDLALLNVFYVRLLGIQILNFIAIG